MQIDQLDTKTPQDEGAFLHLNHTVYGHPMYTGDDADEHGRWTGEGEPDEDKRVGLMVRGMESQTVEEFTNQQQKKNFINSQKKRKVNPADEDYKSGLALACILIVSFVNIYEGETLLAPTDENKKKFIKLSDNLSLQLLSFSRDQDNFFDPLLSD